MVVFNILLMETSLVRFSKCTKAGFRRFPSLGKVTIILAHGCGIEHVSIAGVLTCTGMYPPTGMVSITGWCEAFVPVGKLISYLLWVVNPRRMRMSSTVRFLLYFLNTVSSVVQVTVIVDRLLLQHCWGTSLSALESSSVNFDIVSYPSKIVVLQAVLLQSSWILQPTSQPDWRAAHFWEMQVLLHLESRSWRFCAWIIWHGLVSTIFAFTTNCLSESLFVSTN